MASEPIRVCLVAGHPVILGVLRLACTTAQIEIAGEATDGASGADMVLAVDPQVAVIDLELPDADGLQVIGSIRSSGFTGAVLAVSERTDGATVLEALRLGAGGFLTKPDGLRRVASAIRSLVAGQRVLDPVVQQVAVTELGRFARQAREGSEIGASLSPRERQILALLADGLTTHQIGRQLDISPRTVETHVAKLYRKLSVRSRVAAVARAAQLGLIELR